MKQDYKTTQSKTQKTPVALPCPTRTAGTVVVLRLNSEVVFFLINKILLSDYITTAVPASSTSTIVDLMPVTSETVYSVLG